MNSAVSTDGYSMGLQCSLTQVWRNRRLLGVLIVRDVATRHAGTWAGRTWLYLQPLLTMATYYLVFDLVLKMRMGGTETARGVGTYLIVGMLPWMAFCEGVNRGTTSLLDSATLLQKNALPMALFPAKTVLATGWVYGPLTVLLVLAYSPFHDWGGALWALGPVMMLQLLFTWLLAYLLALLAAAVRDTVQVVAFSLSLGVFLSPILFPMQQFPADWQWVLWLNPMTAFVSAYQAVILQGQWPSGLAWAMMGGWAVTVAWLLNLALARVADQVADWI